MPCMNIAFVLGYLAARFGGPVAAARGLGRALGDMGNSVSYWGTGRGEGCSSVAGGHTYDINWPRSWYRSRGLRQALSAAMPSLDILELSEFWLYPIYAASRVAKGAGVPYILRPAGSLQSWAIHRTRLLKQLKKIVYLRLAGNGILRNAACVRAASMHEAHNIQRLGYHGPITIIPNGVDVPELDDDVDSSEAEAYWPHLKNRPVVLFMSRLSPEKGLDLLIPLWAELVRTPPYRDAILVIAGPDYRGYRKTVEAMIERHNLSPSVILPGMVSDRRKVALLRRADVFVLPSYSENFAIAVAEAMAHGTPVITTTSTPWEQVQKVHAGRWVAPVASELSQALREMLNLSQSQRATMGRNGMCLVRENYTWDIVARKFLRVCECILAARAIPLQPGPIGAGSA